MEKLPMCRICLVKNVRMFVVVNRNWQELYEKLTNFPFVTVDSRPILACFFCCAKLKQCYGLLRQCLKAEELFAQIMIEDYEPNPLIINQDQSAFYSGFIKSPTENISIVDECQTENIAIKEELPDVCERLDIIIEPMEESDELEPENVDNSCQDVTDIPHHSESDLEDDMPLMEVETEVEEEQIVSKKKRKVSKKKRKAKETKKLELENVDNSCQDVTDIPHHSESDLEDDMPLMEVETEVEEEQIVSKKKRKAKETKTAGDSIGSDVDAEDESADDIGVDYPTIVRPPTLATDNPAVLPENFDPRLTNAIDQMDRQNDTAIRAILPSDCTVFDWLSDIHGFTGVREEFTGTPGPTFPMSEIESPVDVFLKIWDQEIMSLIENETNNYAAQCLKKTGIKPSSRVRRWHPTTVHELYIFFALMIHQSLFPAAVESEYFYPSSRMTAMPFFKEYISFNRLILVKKFLHFANNGNMSDSLSLEERRIYKIKPIIDHLNRKFQNLYLPNQNIAIDESLFKRHNHQTLIQKIVTKTAKGGIKSCEFCESDTGYLWKFTVHAAKDTTDRQNRQDLTNRPDDTDQLDETHRPDSTDLQPAGATAEIVYELASPLFNKGYTLIMDHFHNSPLLARSLKLQGTDCYGTLRLTRENVPDSVKSLTKQHLRVGDVVSATSGDLNVIVWKDADIFSMLSTCHKVEIGAKEKYGRWRFKPQVVLDYNKAMGGVDKKDQILSNFPIERSRTSIWYKKLFRRLLNISLQNAFVIYKGKDKSITHRSFRIQVAEGLLKHFFQHYVAPQIRTIVQAKRHLPSTKRGQKPRPVLDKNHYAVKVTEQTIKSCVWCSENSKRSRTTWKCDVCEVALCMECMKPYHTGVRVKKSPVAKKKR